MVYYVSSIICSVRYFRKIIIDTCLAYFNSKLQVRGSTHVHLYILYELLDQKSSIESAQSGVVHWQQPFASIAPHPIAQSRDISFHLGSHSWFTTTAFPPGNRIYISLLLYLPQERVVWINILMFIVGI